MARTLTEIKQSITDQVEAEATLATINTGSSTGIFTALRNVVAASILTLENLWDAFKTELDARSAEVIPGSLAWYADIAKEFQYGDALTVQNGKVLYAVVDETKQIVKYATANEQSGVVIIKAYKETAGEYDKLEPATELVAFKAYMSQRKFAGTKTSIISIDPDLVRVKIRINYSALLVVADVKTAVEAAITNYLKNIPFDGVFNINKLRDAIEAIPEVLSGGVLIDFVQIKPDGGVYSTVPYTYAPVSGRYKIDPAYPLNNAAQITYTAV